MARTPRRAADADRHERAEASLIHKLETLHPKGKAMAKAAPGAHHGSHHLHRAHHHLTQAHHHLSMHGKGGHGGRKMAAARHHAGRKAAAKKK